MGINIRAISAVFVLAASVAANAAITSIGQFSGSLSETFESFDNYFDNVGTFEPEPMSIMGGAASVDSLTDNIAIFEPGVGATWGLILSGSAQPSDGLKAMGVNSFASSFTVSFSADQTEVGAFFGIGTQGGPATATVDFFDAANVLVGSTAFSYDHETTADGILDWNGWSSDIAFRSFTVSGDFLAVDGLQAGSLVPEPASLSVLAIGALAMLRRRKSR